MGEQQDVSVWVFEEEQQGASSVPIPPEGQQFPLSDSSGSSAEQQSSFFSFFTATVTVLLIPSEVELAWDAVDVAATCMFVLQQLF
ncbi:hypothetical protein [Terribacillus halophilus]|uniref:hypothetical protein n=1 Tax=Terribacillus halophilus TaxID=361279 RepID=UPI001FCDC6D2|nr:hypothetical protein [Terribacillus halophilus]